MSSACRYLLIAFTCCGLAMVTTAGAMAQEAERQREASPPRERPGGQDRRGEEDRREDPRQRQGTPDGQPEARLAPEGQGRLVRPPVLPERWHLGVYAYNTERGVMITDVVPGSPAARAGLEPRDLIVTVSGFQVGYVDDNFYPLGEELQNRAGRRGEVRLLVQNWRNNQLVNLDVTLQRRGSYYRRER